MKLGGIDFGPTLDASGARGFFGEGYWYHPLLQPFGLDFTGSTFVAKTTTFHPHDGNMPLTRKGRFFVPREWFPTCIRTYTFNSTALNAVSLSGPGINALFKNGLLEHDGVFMISVAAVEPSREDRMRQMRKMVVALSKPIAEIRPELGIQINVGCPNSKHSERVSVSEIYDTLTIFSLLGKPLVPKVSLLTPIEEMMHIASHPYCDALCFTNAIPFGTLPEQIPWEKLFPSGSPLVEFGGGGLSGQHLLPLVAECIRALRCRDINVPLIAGGGITRASDVDILVDAGLERGKDAIFFGTAAMVRPLNVHSIIRRSHKLLA